MLYFAWEGSSVFWPFFSLDFAVICLDNKNSDISVTVIENYDKNLYILSMLAFS